MNHLKPHWSSNAAFLMQDITGKPIIKQKAFDNYVKEDGFKNTCHFTGDRIASRGFEGDDFQKNDIGSKIQRSSEDINERYPICERYRFRRVILCQGKKS